MAFSTSQRVLEVLELGTVEVQYYSHESVGLCVVKQIVNLSRTFCLRLHLPINIFNINWHNLDPHYCCRHHELMLHFIAGIMK